jgi:hypothetical protein
MTYEAAVIFAHHGNDAVTRWHYQKIQALNPFPVVPVFTDALQHLPGAVNLPSVDGKDESNWFGGDRFLYRFFKRRPVTADRYIFLEWDACATAPLKDYYSEVWDASAAGSEIVTPESEPDWPWFAQRRNLPTGLQQFSAGLRPLNGVLLSHRALAAVAEIPAPRHVFSEYRLGTLLRAAGVKLSALPEHKAKNNSYDPGRIAFDPLTPSLYHPVKTLTWIVR